MPPGLPSRSGLTIAVILYPGLTSENFQPLRWRMLGLPSSTLQCLTSPFWPGTSTSMNTCGLVHSNRVTVPVMVVLFTESNIANEWWAENDPLVSTRTAATQSRRADTEVRASRNGPPFLAAHRNRTATRQKGEIVVWRKIDPLRTRERP